ncbi:MAG: ABC transporter substrate-binding protein [Synergistaceae bacterium]|nr:ABC transporter substrate-binding protein [Synergistaceae bacterium]
MQNLKKSAMVVIASAMLLAGAGFRPAEGAKPDLFVIRVPLKTGFNEFTAADLKGFYEEEGIKAEFIGLLEGLSVYQMLEQGLIDVTDGHTDKLTQARLAGIKVKAVLPGMVDHPKLPHVRYYAREDGPIETLDDIVGKKVGISNYAACNDGYLKAYLNKRGIEGEVEWVVLPKAGQMEQALSQGLIDLSTTHPPFASLVVNAGGSKQVASTWDLYNSPGAGLSIRAFHEDFLAAHPEEVKAFSRAMYKTRKWINENPNEAIPLVSEALGLDPAKVNVELDTFWFSEEPGIKKEDIELWFEISESLGYWNHGDIEPEEVFTNEFDPTGK